MQISTSNEAFMAVEKAALKFYMKKTALLTCAALYAFATICTAP